MGGSTLPNGASGFYIYIIAEIEKKLIPTIKEVVTNRITAYLKFRHV